MENHHFEWENSLYMAIFNSYVKLPEGIYIYIFTHFAFTVCESIETMAGLGALLPHQLLQLRQSLASDGEMDFPWRHMVCSQGFTINFEDDKWYVHNKNVIRI